MAIEGALHLHRKGEVTLFAGIGGLGLVHEVQFVSGPAQQRRQCTLVGFGFFGAKHVCCSSIWWRHARKNMVGKGVSQSFLGHEGH